MDRIAFLDWAAQLLGVNHTGNRFYVTMTRRGLSLGIDAEDTGRMRVHLFSNNNNQVAWMQTLPTAMGPLPNVASPVFRQGQTGGDRYYYGFTWQHSPGAYINEQASVNAFVQFLRLIAAQQGIQFVS